MPLTIAQPAVQQCGKAPLCCGLPCAWAAPSTVTTRGPLAVQMIVVIAPLPDASPAAATADVAINAWKTNRVIANIATHRLPALAHVYICVPFRAQMLSRGADQISSRGKTARSLLKRRLYELQIIFQLDTHDFEQRLCIVRQRRAGTKDQQGLEADFQSQALDDEPAR